MTVYRQALPHNLPETNLLIFVKCSCKDWFIKREEQQLHFTAINASKHF